MDPSHSRRGGRSRSPGNAPASSDEFSNDNDASSETRKRVKVDGLKNVNGSSSRSEDADELDGKLHSTEAGEDVNLSETQDAGSSDKAEPSEEKSSSAADVGEDENLSATQDVGSSDEAEPSEEKSSSAIADSGATSGTSTANSDSDGDKENSSADMDSDADEDLSAAANASKNDKDKKDWTPQVYAYIPRAEDELKNVKIVSTMPWDYLNERHPSGYYKLVHNCYYDMTKRYKDEDTGYYDLHFEVFYDDGGSFLNQLDSRCVVDVSTILFDGRQPNFHWARGFPGHVDPAAFGPFDNL